MIERGAADVYSATVLEHFSCPHRGPSEAEADIVGQAGTPGEGPFMRLFLRCEGPRIVAAGFSSYGCPASQACGSFLSGWIEGKTFDEVAVISADDLMRVLGGLPLGKEHTADLAIRALQDARRRAATVAGFHP